MATRQEVVMELRRYGYDGPISYPKDRLLSLLQARKASGAGDLPAPTVAEAQKRDLSRSKVPAFEDLTPDWEFQVRGEPGAWFRFIAHVTNVDTGEEWIDAVGGTKAHRMWRAFTPSRIKRNARTGVITKRKCHRPVDTEGDE